MGVAFKDLILSHETDIDLLQGKILVLDAYNTLYQFLSTIRGMDGTLLMDSKGNVTSHLVGLFSRTASLMQKGIKPVFVFDGEPPKLKQKVVEQRNELKIEAEKKFLEARGKEDLEEMKKYASRTSRLTKEMAEESKKAAVLMGLPVVQAPSEGEAQAAYMVKKGDGFAVGSQDYDSLLHGAAKVIRNLSITGKRKKPGKIGYETVKPEMIDLSENLNNLGIDQNQLIALAMIIGTDYNQGGIKGIGPKTALKLVKQHGTDFDALFNEVNWNDSFDFEWTEIHYLIKKMPATDNYTLVWKDIEDEKLISLLVKDHDFSEERVKSTLSRLKKETGQKQQRSLADF